MFDLKKATKKELVDCLTQMAQTIEDHLRIYTETAQGETIVILGSSYSEGALFTCPPTRTIQIEDIFWERLVEVLRPEIHCRDAVSRDSVYAERSFHIELCGHKYEIINLYTEEEI